MDSLVEARLDVGPNQKQMRARDSYELQAPWDATNLIMGVHNVQTLHLTSDTLEVFILPFIYIYGVINYSLVPPMHAWSNKSYSCVFLSGDWRLLQDGSGIPQFESFIY